MRKFGTSIDSVFLIHIFLPKMQVGLHQPKIPTPNQQSFACRINFFQGVYVLASSIGILIDRKDQNLLKLIVLRHQLIFQQEQRHEHTHGSPNQQLPTNGAFPNPPSSNIVLIEKPEGSKTPKNKIEDFRR